MRGEGDPQPTVTAYQCLETFAAPEPVGPHPTARYSLMELIPRTGRIDQLRRHMKHLSHPIIGDTRYGDGRHNRFFREKFACHRLLLTACVLDFPHPYTGRDVRLKTEPDCTDLLDEITSLTQGGEAED